MGPCGDAIVQMDWMTGQIMAEPGRLGIEGETLVIFTSDNGPVLNDGYEDGAAEMLGSHKPGGPLRGGKYSAFEAGARVPTIAYWPGRIQPGTSAALMSQADLVASLGALAGASLPDDVAIDSRNLLGAWLGDTSHLSRCLTLLAAVAITAVSCSLVFAKIMIHLDTRRPLGKRLFQRIQRVREMLKAAGIRLFFLPPYSPDLNPIEEMFPKLKRLLRKAPRRLPADQPASPHRPGFPLPAAAHRRARPAARFHDRSSP